VDRATAGEILTRLHMAQAAFYSGENDRAVRDVLADDIEWHVPGDNAIAGDYHGIDAVLDYFTRRRALANNTFRMHPRDILTGSCDEVAALTDGTATIDGVEHSWSTVGLYRIGGDRISACWLLPLDPAAFDVIWAGPR
jgi:ketosteroid isomerase-like protein